MAEVAAHEHDSIVVYDDLQLDDDGRPAKWLYHVECLTCGRTFNPPSVPNTNRHRRA